MMVLAFQGVFTFSLAPDFQLWIGLLLASGLTLGAKATKSVDWSGAISGGVIAFLLFAAFGWNGVGQLMGFFVLRTAASRFGYSKKQKQGTAQEIRTWRNASANAGVGALCAVAGLFLPPQPMWGTGMAASFAAAASDTVAGEIGRLYGRHPRMITTWKPARSGENGAISLIGTVTGLLTAGAMAGIALLFHPGGSWKTAGIITLAGFAGNLVDSLLGAVFENRGLLNNEQVNLGCTLAAAIMAICMEYVL